MRKLLIYAVLLVAGLTALMALFPEKTTELFFRIERSASGLNHTTITIAGETWTYLEGGPEDAEVLLMLHGFGGDKDNWTRFARSLTDNYRVIAPDLPGFGESVLHRDRDYSLPVQRDRVQDFATALGLERFHVVGNSMGGQLAALYAHEYPQQLITLALFNNGGITAPVQTEFDRALSVGENSLVVESSSDFDDLLEIASYKKPFIPWPAKGVLAQRAMEHAESNAFIFEFLFSEEYLRLEPILAELSMPVLILWGEFDRVLDVSSVDVMRPLLPAAEVVIMKETGHLPMIERPAETATHYLEFIEPH